MQPPNLCYMLPANLCYMQPPNLCYMQPPNLCYMQPANLCYMQPPNLCYMQPLNLCYMQPLNLCYMLPLNLCYMQPINLCYMQPINLCYMQPPNLCYMQPPNLCYMQPPNLCYMQPPNLCYMLPLNLCYIQPPNLCYMQPINLCYMQPANLCYTQPAIAAPNRVVNAAQRGRGGVAKLTSEAGLLVLLMPWVEGSLFAQLLSRVQWSTILPGQVSSAPQKAVAQMTVHHHEQSNRCSAVADLNAGAAVSRVAIKVAFQSPQPLPLRRRPPLTPTAYTQTNPQALTPVWGCGSRSGGQQFVRGYNLGLQGAEELGRNMRRSGSV
ncbi:hypothetical protein HAZT_HAZT006115 [Hyalella azteca]|uniref:Uncharacterized protein n=1 Tax=Hyalella azteca TaxID=294128 RepID=A0A6A0H860_HYAAZ|nr:hypothetical protein HAZT_HAZT006115 [Hyalella azteca]